MKPEHAKVFDELEAIARGLNDTIENVAITEIPCELHSWYITQEDEEGSKPVKHTQKIVSSKLTKLLVSGLYDELRGMEVHVMNRYKRNEISSEDALEIVARLEQIRKLM